MSVNTNAAMNKVTNVVIAGIEVDIVVGAAAKGPLLRFLTGSVTSSILASAPVPVAVVAAPPLSPLQRYGIPAGVGLGLVALILASE